MKNTIVLAMTLLLTSSAWASDNACTTKQKNAASLALAQREAAPVQSVMVSDFKPGQWTEGVAENNGSDTVTVVLETADGTLIQAYEVSAKQIGASADCDITSVKAVSIVMK